MLIFVKDTDNTITVRLVDQAGTAVTGLTYLGVFVDLRKDDGAFFSKSLVLADVTDLGSGYYDIELSSSDCDTVGELVVRISGNDIRTEVLIVSVVSSAPTAQTNTPSPPVGYVYGYLYDSSGLPMDNSAVVCMILSFPNIYSQYSSGVLLSSNLITDTTDSEGFFVIPLIVGTVIDVIISDANYRRSITVPSGSMNLFDMV